MCSQRGTVRSSGLKERTPDIADVTIVIPVRDEAHTIEALLADLGAQRRKAAEMLVVDAGSKDDTVKRVEAISRHDPSIRLLGAPGAYPGGARNAAIRQVRTEWIAFVDAGIRIADDWLECLLEPVDQDPSVDAVLGGLEPIVDTRIQRAAALAYVSPRQRLSSGGQWRGYCLPSSMVRTSVVRNLGASQRRSVVGRTCISTSTSERSLAWHTHRGRSRAGPYPRTWAPSGGGFVSMPSTHRGEASAAGGSAPSPVATG